MQKNMNWTITDIDEEAGAGQRPRAPSKSAPAAKVGRRGRRRSRGLKRVARALLKPNISGGALAFFGVFIIMLTILFLHSWTVSLNKDVRSLQDDLSKINSEIDSKNGRLISNADLKTIEEQARALGMTEAQSSQYVYEAAAKKQTAVSDQPAGLYDFISFFIQLRNEKLWPKRQ